MSKIVTQVENLAGPLLQAQGYDLIEVQYRREGSRWILRLFIDKPGGITIDDCEIASQLLDEPLDEADFIPHSYYLEVSSPGADRPIKTDLDFRRNLGREIEIKLYAARDGKKVFEGFLKDWSDSEVRIDTPDGEQSVARDGIASIKPIIRF